MFNDHSERRQSFKKGFDAKKSREKEIEKTKNLRDKRRKEMIDEYRFGNAIDVEDLNAMADKKIIDLFVDEEIYNED
jgi:hypothetical protein